MDVRIGSQATGRGSEERGSWDSEMETNEIWTDMAQKIKEVAKNTLGVSKGKGRDHPLKNVGVLVVPPEHLEFSCNCNSSTEVHSSE